MRSASWIDVGSSSGTQPYVARDLLQFPAALLADGLLDVVIQEVVSVFYSFLPFLIQLCFIITD